MAKDNTIQGTQTRKRLVLCFDGTWNTPEDGTNVSRIHAAIADRHSGCDEQLKFYDEGVGTTWGSRLQGGIFGWGLDENILEGYCWLIDNYSPSAAGPAVSDAEDDPQEEKFEDGDDIYLFGFSRGAFTARSLSGLINACGLIKKEAAQEEAGEGRTTIGSPLVQKAWELYRERQEGVDPRTEGPCKDFRRDYSSNVKIRFIGVWDTVGALGVPGLGGSLLPTRKFRYGFHDTSLCRIVEHAYHAVAIDEHRRDYEVSLWRKWDPIATQCVQQRWFPGAHSNVGGGYEDDLLPELSLLWMAERACAVGLKFAWPPSPQPRVDDKTTKPCIASCEEDLQDFQLNGSELMAPVRDSFKEFMYGLYQAGAILRSVTEPAVRGVKGILGALGFGGERGSSKVDGLTGIDGRYYRPMLVNGVNEVIDPSARTKCAKDPRYSPRNLAYAGREAAVVGGPIDWESERSA